MPRFLIDTNILIDHLRGRPEAHALLAKAVEDGQELWGITVTRTEVLAGMRASEEPPTLELLAQLRWLDVTSGLADEAGMLARLHHRSHPGIETVDYLIAAATQALEADLQTLNVKHFPMFEGLIAPYR
ncbi:MAG: type II toxin-antitoxin system VapC family toxin [Chloroflexi bacterium]|nr:type II toxin-antitoxin system VapC family toxin [Chloroflexota bacterium]